MHLIIWKYRVRRNRAAEFETAYGSDGPWAAFFSQDPDYHGTRLLKDPSDPAVYLTVDRWSSAEDFDRFKRSKTDEYNAIDAACDPLTLEEQLIARVDWAS